MCLGVRRDREQGLPDVPEEASSNRQEKSEEGHPGSVAGPGLAGPLRRTRPPPSESRCSHALQPLPASAGASSLSNLSVYSRLPRCGLSVRHCPLLNYSLKLGAPSLQLCRSCPLLAHSLLLVLPLNVPGCAILSFCCNQRV